MSQILEYLSILLGDSIHKCCASVVKKKITLQVPEWQSIFCCQLPSVTTNFNKTGTYFLHLNNCFPPCRKLQARGAFATYLLRVQQRLLEETSRTMDKVDEVTQNDEQMVNTHFSRFSLSTLVSS